MDWKSLKNYYILSENIFFFFELIWIDFFFKIIARLNRSNYKIIHQYKILHKMYIPTTMPYLKSAAPSYLHHVAYGKFNKWYYFWILAACVQVAAFIWFMDSLSCLVNNSVLMMMHGHYTHLQQEIVVHLSRGICATLYLIVRIMKKKTLLLHTLSSSHTRFSLFGNI